MPRPRVDVVLPVAGDVEGARRVLARLALRPGDTATVVDNRGTAAPVPGVLVAAEVHSSYFARNAGARRGSAPWIVFLDADCEPAADLLDRYLDPEPEPGVAVVAGGIEDGPGGSRAQRYARARASMSAATALAHGDFAFAQTANALVRREAFDAAGGFAEDVVSGADADLCLRLRAAGWGLASRPAARVVHHNRTSVRAMLRQRARHGTGAAWVAGRHPGAFPARSLPGLAWWGVRRWARAAAARARGDRDEALLAALDPLAVWAYELGRRRSNAARRGR